MKKIAIVGVMMLSVVAVGTAGDGSIKRRENPRLNGYVVVLKATLDEDPDLIADHFRGAGAAVDKVFRHTFNGFSITAPEAVARRLSADPRVLMVEEDALVRTSGTTYISPTFTSGTPTAWGIDRINQRVTNSTSPLDGYYTYGDCEDGEEVRIYVVDSGVWSGHSEFLNASGVSRVVAGYDYVTGGPGSERAPCGLQSTNYHASHGTAVASVAAGRTVGAAPKATIVPVRAFDCASENYISEITAALDWIAADPNRGGQPGVVVASWGYKVGMDRYAVPATCAQYPPACIDEGDLTAIDQAVIGLLGQQFVVVTSAENGNTDASIYSPNRVPAVLTVGATTRSGQNDQRLSSSNFGSAVDVWAPGAVMKVAHWPGTSDYRTVETSGTSFAAPLVAGVAARFRDIYPSDSAAQIHDRIVNDATTPAHGNTILSLGPNDNQRMLYKSAIRCRAFSNP